MNKNAILKLLGLAGIEPIEEDGDSVLPMDTEEDWEELPPYMEPAAEDAETPAYLYEEEYDPAELAELEAEDETAVYTADAPDDFYPEEYGADAAEYEIIEAPEELDDTLPPSFAEKLRTGLAAAAAFCAGLFRTVKEKLQAPSPTPVSQEDYYTDEFGSSLADDFSGEFSEELAPQEAESAQIPRARRFFGGDRRMKDADISGTEENDLVDDLLGDSTLDDLMEDRPPVAVPQQHNALVRQTFRTAVQDTDAAPAAEDPAAEDAEEELHPRREAFRPKFFYSADEVEEFRREKEEQAAEEQPEEEQPEEESAPEETAAEEVSAEAEDAQGSSDEESPAETSVTEEEFPEEEEEEEEAPAPAASAPLAARNHGVVVALGMFDGVHAGHQHLLSMARKDADQLGLPLHVVTFYEHPASVLTGKPIPYLTTLEDRIGLLTQYGMDCLNIYHFTPRFASMHYRDFIRMLIQELDMTHIVLGQDAVFGRGGQGNPRILMREAENLGISVHVVPDVTANGMRVSSSNIRMAAANGEIAFANACLTRPYTLAGMIVPGAQRGALLGYPTANLLPGAGMLVPANGVYFSQILLADGVVRNSITNIGVHPTVDELELPIIETHILDYDEDCYGQPAHVALLQMLRPEQKFDTFAELTAQIARDTRTAREFFSRIGL